MEHRPPPPVTIEGGSGWQLDGPPADALVDVDPDAVAVRRVVLVLVGLLVAAGLAALLADVRSRAATRDGAVPVQVRVERDRDGLRARPVPAAPVYRADGVEVRVTGYEVDDGVAVVGLEAVNASGGAVTVEAVQPSPGLAAQLRAPDGSPLALPLVLPPGRRALVGELSVTDCTRLTPEGRAWTGGTLVELRLADEPGGAFFGSRYPLLAALESAACPAEDG
ncbi:MAG: hypothetical protein ACLGIG_04885 [Actinomycetes bacterium]